METYEKCFECPSAQARKALARVLFYKEEVFKKINVLSGGEKIRLKLLLLMDQKVNVLLLDEPTNHLDIESREILENSLLTYDGTVIAISHDRYFINKFTNRIAEIENARLKVYDGDYDAYILEKQKEKDKEIQVKNTFEKNQNKKQPKSIDENKLTEKKQESILLEIQKKEEEVSDLIQQMNLVNNDFECLKDLHHKKAKLEQEMEELYEQLENYL